jgi:NAD(P)-dependent dehydrogenase (short-subunit alcohol dehydrogenase family)
MKTILITGASSGIGRATAIRFQSEGWNVAATMRHPERETELQQLDRVAVFPLEVTDPNSINTAVASTIDRFGTIDVLLNNAGYGLVGALEAVDPAQLERQFATNVFGCVYTIQACLPHFRSQKSGLIINVSSIGGRIALPFNSLYHGTKFAIEGISESLALELAPHGIRVKIVEPGGVKTDFAGRSLDLMHKDGLDAYDVSIQRAMAVFTSPERASGYSEAADIADVIYTAATDGTDSPMERLRQRLRYLAGKDAEAMAIDRDRLSDEEYAQWAISSFNL